MDIIIKWEFKITNSAMVLCIMDVPLADYMAMFIATMLNTVNRYLSVCKEKNA